jgi:hypothetical protein
MDCHPVSRNWSPNTPQVKLSFKSLTIPQISVRARGPLAAMTHEAGQDSSKSLDQVRVRVSCIRVQNLPCL